MYITDEVLDEKWTEADIALLYKFTEKENYRL